jgi:hypothetical protein
MKIARYRDPDGAVQFAQVHDDGRHERLIGNPLGPDGTVRPSSEEARIAHLLAPLFHVLASLGHDLNPESLYVIDSFPVAACDNIRINRSRRYRGEAWRGYQASKRRLQAMVDAAKVLTPEQRKQLAERMSQRGDMMERHHRERRALEAPKS